MTLPTEAETLLRDVERLPLDLGDLLDRLRREFRRRDIEEDVGARRFELDDVVIDRGLGGLEAFLGDDHGSRLGAEAVFEALDVVLAVIVILIHHGDLGVGLLFEKIFCVDPRSLW